MTQFGQKVFLKQNYLHFWAEFCKIVDPLYKAARVKYVYDSRHFVWHVHAKCFHFLLYHAPFYNELITSKQVCKCKQICKYKATCFCSIARSTVVHLCLNLDLFLFFKEQ